MHDGWDPHDEIDPTYLRETGMDLRGAERELSQLFRIVFAAAIIFACILTGRFPWPL